MNNSEGAMMKLHLSCSQLPDHDKLSKCNAVCVVLTRRENIEIEIGRTECVQHDLNPKWSQRINIVYKFEEVKQLVFRILDLQDGNQQIVIAEFETSVAQLIQNKTQITTLQNNGNIKSRSKIDINCELVKDDSLIVRAQFEGKNLCLKSLAKYGESIYYIISTQDHSVLTSESLKLSANPVWKPFNLTLYQLCNENYDAKLRIDFYVSNSNKVNYPVGRVEETIGNIILKGEAVYNILSVNKITGGLQIKEFVPNYNHVFAQYLKRSLQMNFSIAVDFTMSNGSPDKPTSLHYNSTDVRKNQYASAICAVGDVIKQYDRDQLYPAYGFGAKLNGEKGVSHDFNLNLSKNNPNCIGIEGLLSAYNCAINGVKLSGPTNFTPVIRKMINTIKKSKNNYFVLLIITDGQITDMDKTKEAIVDASSLPMSIIIVGVGKENFSSMKKLDSDKKLLVDRKNRRAKRDIVQFVEMRKFKCPDGITYCKESLSAEVMEEIPRQVVDYMIIEGINL